MNNIVEMQCIASLQKNEMKTVLSLGSNLGDRDFYLTVARAMLEQKVGELTRMSEVMETKSWGYDSHDYLNQVVECETELEPTELLRVLKEIEVELGRPAENKTKPGTQDYHDRTIDIDILYYEDVEMDTPELTIPHPRIQERPFIQELLDKLK
jgi:2-amino-4-hydroxy-6-hydroxymethyldihydropteridine diphosphokinase